MLEDAPWVSLSSLVTVCLELWRRGRVWEACQVDHHCEDCQLESVLEISVPIGRGFHQGPTTGRRVIRVVWVVPSSASSSSSLAQAILAQGPKWLRIFLLGEWCRDCLEPVLLLV